MKYKAFASLAAAIRDQCYMGHTYRDGCALAPEDALWTNVETNTVADAVEAAKRQRYERREPVDCRDRKTSCPCCVAAGCGCDRPCGPPGGTMPPAATPDDAVPVALSPGSVTCMGCQLTFTGSEPDKLNWLLNHNCIRWGERDRRLFESRWRRFIRRVFRR